MRKFLLLPLALLLALLAPLSVHAGSSSQMPANRVRIGNGAPAAGECNSSGSVGKIYVRADAGAVFSTLYICANTGASTYAWEGPYGTGSGGGTIASAYSAAVSAQTTLSVTAATHGMGVRAIAFCLDNTSPAAIVACSYTRNGSGDLVFTWNPAFSGSIEVLSGGLAGATVSSGTATLGTSSISANACATTVTVSATGVLSTDAIVWTPNANISAVTGYGKQATDGLRVYPWPSADNVNFAVCNGSGSSITPGAVTLNWRVVR